MARPPHARERVLDAFEELLISEGERSATLDAIAQAAGVSKGGLLYHFGSRDELIAGLTKRLRERVDADVAEMLAAPEGPVAYYLRTSVDLDGALARSLTAVSRLAQSGSTAAAETMHWSRHEWAGGIRPCVRNEAALETVMLLGDGLYFNNALDEGSATPVNPTGAALQAVIDLVCTATAR